MKKKTCSLVLFGMLGSIVLCVVVMVMMPALIALHSREIKDSQIAIPKTMSIDEHSGIEKVQEFCNKFSLSCEEKPFPLYDRTSSTSIWFLNFLFKGREYEQIHNLTEQTHLIGLHIASKVQLPYGQGEGKPFAYFFVSDISKDLELYANYGVHRSIYKHNFSHEKNKVIWPAFMSKKQAKKVIDKIAAKLRMPDDMEFERLNTHEGVWSAVWVRKREGYRYEGDAITINIMGGSGEFIGYTRTYRGKPCLLDVKLSKETAIELGWKEFKKIVPAKRASALYITNAELLIINKDSFRKSAHEENSNINGSKLAWVVKFDFNRNVDIRTKIHNPSEFEIRLDASSGELLYISDVPWYQRWFKKS